VPRHSDTQLVYMALAILNKFVPHSLQKPYSNDGHPIRTRLVNTILQKKIEGCHQSEDILQGHYCQAMKTVDLCKIKYMDRMAERIWGHPCLADVQGHLFDLSNGGVDRAQFPTSLVDPLETDGLLWQRARDFSRLTIREQMDSLFIFSAVALLIDTLAPDYVHYKDAEELKPLWTWMDGLNQRPTESMPRKKKMKLNK